MTSGVYCFENIVDGKRYIGQSKNLERRYREHSYQIKNNKDSSFLQRAVNIYGIDCFIYYVLELCEKDQLDFWESFWITTLDTRNKDNGYNLTSGGTGIPNYIHTEYSKLGWKDRSGANNSFFGKHHTKETRLKISESHIGIGHKQSEETKEKISKSNLGKVGHGFTPEQLSTLSTVKLGSKNPFYGKHHSDETKHKIIQTKLINKLLKVAKESEVEQ